MPHLDEWEKRLKPFFDSRLRIIGEIPLSESDLDEIAESVRNYLGGFDTFTKATNRLTDRYPFVFMTLLAQFAMHNDQAGYWQALQQRVGADQDLHITRWHQRFVNIAQQHGLKTFTESDAANYYVATIRFHGGIPSYSLPDFFDRMVVPAVNQPELRKLPAKDSLNILLRSVYFVDRPVLDFLNNSGDMGLAWFEACCKLVRHAKENHGEVLPISLVPELPYNIHAFFEKYNDEHEDRGFHWSRPILEVNPLSEDSPVVLHIHEQIITTQAASQILQWNISWPEQVDPVIIPCQLTHRRSGEFVLEEFFPVPTPTDQITVSITSGLQGELRRWTIPLLPPPGQAPLIVFRENRRQVPDSHSLPAQVLYLLTPKLSSMEVDSTTTERFDSFTFFTAGWKDWKLELWNLTTAVSLLLYQDGKELGNVVPVAREVAQPELSGGHLFDYQEYPDQPLYTSEIPSVSIPTAVNVTEYQALRDWKVRLVSIGEAAPKIDRQVTLLEYQENCQFEGSRAFFPLQSLLGEKPAGIYDIKVSGPHGLKADYRLRLWPKLLLQNYSKELPRAEESREPVKFNIYLQEGAWVESQPGADPVKITRDANSFSILALPESRRVELDLVTTSQTGEQIRVPVSIPVVRLRWGLIEENSPSMLAFSQNVLHISKERFAQYASSALHVEMHGLGDMAGRLSCQLVEADNEDNVLQIAEFKKTGFTSDWLRVSLLQFSNTVQTLNTQVQFQLVYQQNWQNPLIRYALLEVSPELDIRDAALQQVSECDWKLAWKEDLPLKNRRVMLKSAWLPWAPTFEQKIPDENRGEYTFTDIALPPSSYQIYFYIKYKWEPILEIPPENGTCLSVNLISPGERLAALEKIAGGHDVQFRQLIEKACILDSLGETLLRDEAVSAAATHLKHLQDVQTLVGTIKWMRDKKEIDSSISSFFYKFMFHQDLVRAMLRKYPQGDANLFEYLHMITASIYAESAKLLLEKVDDPIVVRTCMEVLLEREEPDLPRLVVSMIEQGRITADSAAEILAQHPSHRMWAVEAVAGLERSNTTDSLLVAILPPCVDAITQASPGWLQATLLRAAVIERSRELILHYMKILICLKRDEVWQVLIEKEQVELITHQEFYELLRLDPEKAFQALKQDDNALHYSVEIHRLEEEFPHAAGVLNPGMILLTPFGQAQIVSIRHLDGTVAQAVHRADSNFILKVVGGTGLDRVEVDMDFSRLTLQFRNAATIYGCRKCTKFFHPRQQRLDEHYRQSHPSEPQSFHLLHGSIPFNLDDIQYANQTN